MWAGIRLAQRILQGEVFNLPGAGIAAAIDIGGQLYRNGGDWRCVDLVETGAAALTGGLLPGVGQIFKDYLGSGTVTGSVIGGGVAGNVVRGAYAVPPQQDGPFGRLSLPLGDLLRGLGAGSDCGCRK